MKYKLILIISIIFNIGEITTGAAVNSMYYSCNPEATAGDENALIFEQYFNVYLEVKKA